MTPFHASNFIVICWYRPPTPGNNKESFEALRNLLSAVNAGNEGKEIILIGDTNCDLKDCKDGCTKSIKTIYSEFQFEQQLNCNVYRQGQRGLKRMPSIKTDGLANGSL